MKLFINFLIIAFLAIFKIQFCYSWYLDLYAYTNSFRHGELGVAIRDSSGEHYGDADHGGFIVVTPYNCGCDYINVALRIEDGMSTQYRTIGPGESAAIRASMSGLYQIFVSNNCGKDGVFCRFKVTGC